VVLVQQGRRHRIAHTGHYLAADSAAEARIRRPTLHAGDAPGRHHRDQETMTAMLPLAVTMGEPAGVGGELSLKAWLARQDSARPFFVLDDPARLASLARELGLKVAVKEIARPPQAAGGLPA